MYNKVIVLSVVNAGIFKKYWKKSGELEISKSKDDRILDNEFSVDKKGRFIIFGTRNTRTKSQHITFNPNTIHSEFIKNVITVLVGKRPVSRYRSTCVGNDSLFKDIADRSFVKVESFIDKDKDGNPIYVYEKMTTRKCLDNSWGPANISWHRVQMMATKSLYDNIYAIAKRYYEEPLNVLFPEVAEKISTDPDIGTLIEQAQKDRVGPIASIFKNKAAEFERASYNGLGLFLKVLVTKGVADITRIDAKIAIPVTDEEFELFSNGSGCATIFDGGLVNIDEVIDLEYNTIDNVVSGYVKAEV